MSKPIIIVVVRFIIDVVFVKKKVRSKKIVDEKKLGPKSLGPKKCCPKN